MIKRILRFLPAGAAAAMLGLAALPALAEGKFGFVNTERVMRDSVPAQPAGLRLGAAGNPSATFTSTRRQTNGSGGWPNDTLRGPDD